MVKGLLAGMGIVAALGIFMLGGEMLLDQYDQLKARFRRWFDQTSLYRFYKEWDLLLWVAGGIIVFSGLIGFLVANQ